MTPLERLLDRLPAHGAVVVVGKGGVGKTTTAGALALGLADRGTSVRLVSVDPAHSVADLFGDGGGCGAPLTVEELDAPALAEVWKATDGVALAALVERGTYLREEEVAAFLEPALPGVDEVMAALRLAELSAGAERLVVDTAPTGHALRFLEAAHLLDGWVRAFEAMAAKTGAVAAAFVGSGGALPGEEALERLRESAADFRRLLEGAAWVVVSRPGVVVEAETARLEGRLREAGLAVVARVVVGGAGADDAIQVGGGQSGGCAGLRAWGEGPSMTEPLPEADVGTVGSVGGPGDARGWLASAPPLLITAGKGGVGKSTCAAALALALAETRPVLLLGVDPAGSLADVLGRDLPPGHGEVAPGLRVRQVDAQARFAALAEGWRAEAEALFERVGVGGSAALDQRVVHALWEVAPPGVDELAALAELLEETEAGRTVVVDAAPTGHLLRLLAMPDTALAWVRAILRLLRSLGGAGVLEEAVASTVTLARRLRTLAERLRDPARTGVLVVTAPGALEAAETARLEAALAAGGAPVAAVVVNRAEAGAQYAGRVDFLAPAMAAPPVGPHALEGFLDSWRRPA